MSEDRHENKSKNKEMFKILHKQYCESLNNYKEFKKNMTAEEIKQYLKELRQEKIVAKRNGNPPLKAGRPKGPQRSASYKRKKQRLYYERRKAIIIQKRLEEGKPPPKTRPRRSHKLTEEEKKQKQRGYYLKRREALIKYRKENNIKLKKRGPQGTKE